MNQLRVLKLIDQVEHLFVMAFGAAKAAVFNRSQIELQANADLPARLILRVTWMFDT